MGVLDILLVVAVGILVFGIWLLSRGRKYAAQLRESEALEARLAKRGATDQAEITSRLRFRRDVWYFAGGVFTIAGITSTLAIGATILLAHASLR